MFLLQEPEPSPYDLRFNLFRIPIRTHWSFWLLPLVLGYDLVRAVSDVPGSPPQVVLLLGCVAGVFLSLLIHEMGHALAFRFCGIHARVVLYAFGGLAIPTAGARVGRNPNRLSLGQDAFITAAGPFAQLAAAAIVIGGLIIAGMAVPGLNWFQSQAGIEGDRVDSMFWWMTLYFFLIPSIFWALLNLLPVLPLDGGKLMETAIRYFRGRPDIAWYVSLITAVIVTALGFRTGNLFLAIMFGSLAFGAFQRLQEPRY
jgi:stage IV sporulation protein FB